MKPVETGGLAKPAQPDEGERYQELLALSRVSAAIVQLDRLGATISRLNTAYIPAGDPSPPSSSATGS